MKRIIMIIATAVFTASASMAQNDENKEQRPERKFDKTEMIKKRTDDVVSKYKLNEKQSAQLLELNTKFADKMEPRHRGPRGGRHGMRPAEGGDKPQARPEQPRDDSRRAEMRKKRQADMEAYDAELQKILTKEQYQAYKADMQKRGPRGPRPQK